MRRAVLLLLLLALVPVTPAQAQEPPRRSSTWLPYWDLDEAYRRVLANADLFHTVSPFWYSAGSCTAISGNTGAGADAVVQGLRDAGLAVVPTITAPMLPDAALACLGDPEQRAAHVRTVVDVALSHAYDGVEMDYEHLALTTDPGVGERVRAAYTAFAREVCDALHAVGRTCTHTLMPRTDDTWSVWRGKLMPAVYDYRAVGEVSDRVRVMAYDEHAAATGPGPVAGWPWASAVAAYTAATLPAGKGELGIPLYGRDWVGTSATVVTAPQAGALAARHGVPVRWDDAQRSPTFGYESGGRLHTVWFSDTRSVLERAGLARSHGLGTAFWVAGQEDEATWGHVRAQSHARFWDVVGGELQPAVEDVAARGIAHGIGGDAFAPAAPVSRGQMSTFLTRALGLLPGERPPFSDVDGSVHAQSIASTYEAGIAGGYGDGTFRPGAPVTRGQMATFLVRGLRLDPCEDPPFTDVADDVHRTSVCAVARAGIAGGYADGTYRPGTVVSRGQMAVLLSRALRGR